MDHKPLHLLALVECGVVVRAKSTLTPEGFVYPEEPQEFEFDWRWEPNGKLTIAPPDEIPEWRSEMKA